MRLEMRPLGVRVLVVVAGVIKTNIWENMSGNVKLPERSYYKIAESLIAENTEGGKDRDSRTDRDDFAKLLVADVEKGQTGKIFRGAMSGLVKFGGTWFPQWLIVSTLVVGLLRSGCFRGKQA
jgi:hypothetical protein